MGDEKADEGIEQYLEAVRVSGRSINTATFFKANCSEVWNDFVFHNDMYFSLEDYLLEKASHEKREELCVECPEKFNTLEDGVVAYIERYKGEKISLSLEKFYESYDISNKHTFAHHLKQYQKRCKNDFQFKQKYPTFKDYVMGGTAEEHYKDLREIINRVSNDTLKKKYNTYIKRNKNSSESLEEKVEEKEKPTFDWKFGLTEYVEEQEIRKETGEKLKKPERFFQNYQLDGEYVLSELYRDFLREDLQNLDNAKEFFRDKITNVLFTRYKRIIKYIKRPKEKKTKKKYNTVLKEGEGKKRDHYALGGEAGSQPGKFRPNLKPKKKRRKRGLFRPTEKDNLNDAFLSEMNKGPSLKELGKRLLSFEPYKKKTEFQTDDDDDE